MPQPINRLLSVIRRTQLILYCLAFIILCLCLMLALFSYAAADPMVFPSWSARVLAIAFVGMAVSFPIVCVALAFDLRMATRDAFS